MLIKMSSHAAISRRSHVPPGNAASRGALQYHHQRFNDTSEMKMAQKNTAPVYAGGWRFDHASREPIAAV